MNLNRWIRTKNNSLLTNTEYTLRKKPVIDQRRRTHSEFFFIQRATVHLVPDLLQDAGIAADNGQQRFEYRHLFNSGDTAAALQSFRDPLPSAKINISNTSCEQLPRALRSS